MPSSRKTANASVSTREKETERIGSVMTLEFRASATIPDMNDSNLTTTPASLVKSENNLVWLDCEMTGLQPDVDRIIEIAVIVTGPQLECRIEGPVLVIHQSNDQLGKMDAWNRGTHGKSGLIDKVKASTVTEAQAEKQLLDFLKQYVPKNSSPMCGNSIGQDRRFLVKYMPELEAFFHYRNLDVSTLKELSKRWRPEVYASFKKQQRHTALADVHESIDELEHYRKHFLKLQA
jgi:oligoribonuclease